MPQAFGTVITAADNLSWNHLIEFHVSFPQVDALPTLLTVGLVPHTQPQSRPELVPATQFYFSQSLFRREGRPVHVCP